MTYMIGGVVLGLCLFILPMWAYRRGLKDGIALSKGNTLPPIQTPVQAVQRAAEERKQGKEAKAQEDVLTQGLINLMSYDGSPQKAQEAGDK